MIQSVIFSDWNAVEKVREMMSVDIFRRCRIIEAKPAYPNCQNRQIQVTFDGNEKHILALRAISWLIYNIRKARINHLPCNQPFDPSYYHELASD